MSNAREIVTDMPNEIKQMLGQDEAVYYNVKKQKICPRGRAGPPN